MAENTPYSQFDAEKLILRDQLAIDRTNLANERTLLAYLRSAVALVLAGLTIIHFASQGWFQILGVVCLPAGVVTGVLGAIRYRNMRGTIASIRSSHLPQ